MILDPAPPAHLLLAAGVPPSLALGALLASPRAPLRAAGVAAALGAGLAALAVALRAAGAGSRASFGPLQLDLASSAMLLLVCALGLVVVRFSRRYLAGEPGLPRYARALLGTLASVTLLVLSDHLALLVGAWVATSLGLHQLLTFYRGRPQALVAAHKKFLLSRVADACLAASLGLLWRGAGSLRISAIDELAQAQDGALSPALHGAAVLLVLGVLLKSAQLPFHGWMTQVMEAPTPVSALLHAGVVNIGGFVLIRLAPLLAQAPVARGLLVAAGLTTAIVASLVMTTRVSVKVALAWSTIAQMGFLLVQCGLGAWPLALLHLLAHSLYKAHAFLSAGAAVQRWRIAALAPAPRPSAGVVVAAALGVGAALGAGALALRTIAVAAPSPGPLSLVLALGLAPLLGRALAAGWPVAARLALLAAAVGASSLGWHALFEGALPSPAAVPMPLLGWAVGGGVALLFVLQTLLQARPGGALAAWLQPRLFGGLYLDEWFTRMTFRLWPPRTPAPAPRLALSATQEVPSC